MPEPVVQLGLPVLLDEVVVGMTIGAMVGIGGRVGKGVGITTGAYSLTELLELSEELVVSGVGVAVAGNKLLSGAE